MKTTFDLPDGLLRDVRSLARHRHTTSRSLVEQALRRLLEEANAEQHFSLRDASVAGDGPSPEFADASWDRLRDAIYER